MLIEQFDPAFARIIDPSTQVEFLAEGFNGAEGPVWDWRKACLYFSDIANNRIYKWSPAEGLTVYREPSQKANGLTLDAQGQLLICEHRGRRISRQEADGSLVDVVTHYQGKRLNSPCDLTVKSDGSIYFSDPPFGFFGEAPGAIGYRELDFVGVWRLAADGKTLTLLTRDFDTPNGMTFSPDEARFYLADTKAAAVHVFDVAMDGALKNPRLFANFSGEAKGMADGVKVDRQGNVYCTGPGGLFIYDPAGKLLGELNLGWVTNLGWGDADWQTLYVTGVSSLMRLRLKIPGLPVGG